MARKLGSSWPMEPCYICGSLEPRGKFHEYPWHLTCPYDEAGRKKVAQWRREQKKIAESEVPKLL